jgi:glyoxylase I family protein
MLNTGTLHHVSLPVSDIDRAKAFYGEVLGLEEDRNRPDFDFKGAWYNVGDRKLHLIVATTGEHPTFRLGKAIDSHDSHFAIRVPSFSGAVAFLESRGYRKSDERNPEPTADNPRPMRVNAAGKAGFPQIYILDPDCNVIEINAERQD